jgi:hypothetical protein
MQSTVVRELMALYVQWIAEEVQLRQATLERHAEVFQEMRESLQNAMCREALAEATATVAGTAQFILVQQGPEGVV